MKNIVMMLLVLVSIGACSQSNTQQQKGMQVGGPCEGCEAIHETPIPFEQLADADTLPDFQEYGEKIEIAGVVYQKDGRPAKNVVIYVYHTNQAGIYPTRGDEKGWGKRHGYIRGWVKTNDKGEYRFYTLRPASYPNSSNPQHIHVTIKEPGISEYWIDDFHFSDDPLVTDAIRETKGKRGGSGLVALEKTNGISKATRNIVLGLNVPGY